MIWQGQKITVKGMGHFPDTLMVTLENGSVIEIYRKELTDGRGK